MGDGKIPSKSEKAKHSPSEVLMAVAYVLFMMCGGFLLWFTMDDNYARLESRINRIFVEPGNVARLHYYHGLKYDLLLLVRPSLGWVVAFLVYCVLILASDVESKIQVIFAGACFWPMAQIIYNIGRFSGTTHPTGEGCFSCGRSLRHGVEPGEKLGRLCEFCDPMKQSKCLGINCKKWVGQSKYADHKICESCGAKMGWADA
jgi:hypothetical protein